MATRGIDGPGEVLLRLNGGTEAFLAWSEQPLALGTEVAVYDTRGERSVEVMEFDVEPDS